MKIRKLKGDQCVNDDVLASSYDDVVAMCQMITVLKEARDVSQSIRESEDFQGRCNDAIIALANKVLETHVEKFYEPDTKRFRVAYDVKRSGVHTMEVDAETEADATNVVRAKLLKMKYSEFDGMKTDFIAADVVEAKEMTNG